VYLRVDLGLPELLGASGIAVFHVAMLIGRLSGVALQRRLPRQALLTGAGVGVAAGMATALATTALPLVLLGLLVVGLSTAVVAPVAISLAGDAAGPRAGAVTSMVVTTGYATSLLGPGLVGGIGELASLRVGLLVVVGAGVLLAAVGSLAASRVPVRRQ
jgi:MFS family permease